MSEGRARTVHSQVYTEVDGLPSREFNGGSFPAGVVARDGRLWLPSVKGVVIVDPARVDPAPPSRRGRTSNASSSMAAAVAVDGPAAHAGPARAISNSSTPRFASSRRRGCASAIKLDGFDADWVDAGARRTAYYTNVPPGRYVFRVQASNEAGGWGAASVDLADHA